MHSPADCGYGDRCFISPLDLAILKDTGLPVADSIAPPRITRLQRNADGSITLSWTGTNANVRVQSKATLIGGAWETITETLTGTSWNFHPDVGISSRFFRIVVP